MFKVLKFTYYCFKRKDINFFRSFRYNFCCKRIKCNTHSYVFVSKGCRLYLEKNSHIEIQKGNLEIANSYIDVYGHSTIFLKSHSEWVIVGNVNINGAFINLWPKAYFECGRLKINAFTKLNIQKRAIFGDDVGIARLSYVTDTNSHDILINGKPIDKQSDLIIGDNVWIGSNCNILRGSHIGNHVVVGAGTTIASTIPDNTLIRNNNEKVLKNIDGFRW